MNFDRLRFVAERAELGEQREAMLAVTIPERPGSFRDFCSAARQAQRHRVQLPLRRPADGARLRRRAGARPRRDATSSLARAAGDTGSHASTSRDNELAKLHVRHMVGGHAPGVANEILYRFEFPERPARCMKFLNSMGAAGTSALFHYRNHGADYGRVLVGMQVPPPRTRESSTPSWRGLGYPFHEESRNPAYRLFLA